MTFTASQLEMLHTRLHITTNFTSLYLPIMAYTGRLSCITAPTNCSFLMSNSTSADGNLNNSLNICEIKPSKEPCSASLDFGISSIKESRRMLIQVANPNPYSVQIFNVMSDTNTVKMHLHSLADRCDFCCLSILLKHSV